MARGEPSLSRPTTTTLWFPVLRIAGWSPWPTGPPYRLANCPISNKTPRSINDDPSSPNLISKKNASFTKNSVQVQETIMCLYLNASKQKGRRVEDQQCSRTTTTGVFFRGQCQDRPPHNEAKVHSTHRRYQYTTIGVNRYNLASNSMASQLHPLPSGLLRGEQRQTGP